MLFKSDPSALKKGRKISSRRQPRGKSLAFVPLLFSDTIDKLCWIASCPPSIASAHSCCDSIVLPHSLVGSQYGRLEIQKRVDMANALLSAGFSQALHVIGHMRFAVAVEHIPCSLAIPQV